MILNTSWEIKLFRDLREFILQKKHFHFRVSDTAAQLRILRYTKVSKGATSIYLLLIEQI